MADTIGVLGESTATTVATTTVFTCPATKAAKVKLMFIAQGSAAGGTIIAILVNGMEVSRVLAMTASFYVFSVKGSGLRAAEQAALPIGTTNPVTVSPADPIYFLNAGDTIQYTISGAAAIAMNFQVVGVAIDI